MPGRHRVAGIEPTEQELEGALVVGCGLWPGSAILWIIRRTEAVAVCLHAPILGAIGLVLARVDAWQQAARRVRRPHIRIDALRELVLLCLPHGNAVQRLAVGRIGFAADDRAATGSRHQVAFVRAIEKHASANPAALLRRDLLESGAGLRGSDGGSVDAVDDRFEARLRQHARKLGAGDPRLEGECHIAALLLAAPGELVAGFSSPACGVVVVTTQAAVELAREPADRRVGPDIRGTEPGGRHAPDPGVAVDQYDAAMQPLRLDCRDDAGGSCAIDAHIDFEHIRPAQPRCTGPEQDGDDGGECGE